MLDQELFHNVFFDNIRARSRTVQGTVKTEVSLLKQPLLKEGEERQKQLAQNLDRLVKVVWEEAGGPVHAPYLRHLFQGWIELLNDGLVDHTWYAGYRARHSAYRHLNPHYRIWQVRYHPDNPIPERIQGRMVDFSQRLSEKIASLSPTINRVELADHMAFADRKMDLIIHPWLDGCGRFATALVMWIGLRCGREDTLPRFGERERHYRAMQNATDHRNYFLSCLSAPRRQ